MAVPWLWVEGFEVLCDVTAAPRVWQALEAAARKLGVEAAPFGNEAFELLRIEAGVPRFGVELSEKVIPLEANLDHTISYTKGCYLGQEIIARLDTLGTPARLLRHLFVDADGVPAPGTKLLAEGKSVGQIERSIRSSRFDTILAMGFVKRDHNADGTVLDLEGGGQVVVRALP
jgi:folate-binding protein YgfZ